MKPWLVVLAGGVSALLYGADDWVKIDNESVRVLRVVDEPHKKSAMHEHKDNRVMIYLDAGNIDLTHEGGRVDHQHWKAGQVAWSPGGGMHTSENVGGSAIRIVEIELKKPAPAQAAKRDPKMDPVATDGKHNTVLLDNAQVRVFRSWREPGGSESMHEHTGAGRVSVMVTPLTGEVKEQNGTVRQMKQEVGDAVWGAPGSHAVKNLGKDRFEVIVVEVK